MPIKKRKRKLDAMVRDQPRWMKLMGCAPDMEELLGEISIYFKENPEANWNKQIDFVDRIRRLLKRTGRYP